MKLLTILALFAAMLFPATVFSTNIQEPSGFTKKAYDATFALFVTDTNSTRFECTAIIYSKTPTGYRLISAGHCVSPNPLATYSVSSFLSEKRVPVSLVKYENDAATDISVFDLVTKDKHPVIPLGNENDSKIGEKVLNVSFGDAIEKHINFGKISSFKLGETIDCGECINHFLVDVGGAPGSSGSAIISEKTHKIIGIATLGFTEAVGMAATPVSIFNDFMARPEQAKLPVPEPSTIIIIPYKKT